MEYLVYLFTATFFCSQLQNKVMEVFSTPTQIFRFMNLSNNYLLLSVVTKIPRLLATLLFRA